MTIQLLCHFDGSNDSTTIIDETGNSDLYCLGNARLSNTGQVFGTACLFIDGGQILDNAAAIVFASNDCTLRFRYTPHATDLSGSWRGVVSVGNIELSVQDGILTATVYFADNTATAISLGILSIGNSYAISIERFGNNFYGYLNSTLINQFVKSETASVYDTVFGSDDSATSIFGKIDELLIDNGTSYAQGASSYTVETAPFILTPPVLPDFQLVNYAVSGFDAVLINKLAPITKFDAELVQYCVSGFDAALVNAGLTGVDFQLESRALEITRYDAELINIGTSITAFDAQLINECGVSISKADFELINLMLGDTESVVIDIHNPDFPIYGDY